MNLNLSIYDHGVVMQLKFLQDVLNNTLVFKMSIIFFQARTVSHFLCQ